MKFLLTILLLLGTILPSQASDIQTQIQTYTQPYDGATEHKNYCMGQLAILSYIDNAHTSILVCAYGYTDLMINAALIAAERRGIQVRMVMDSTEAATPKQAELVQQLKQAGIELHIGKSAVKHSLIHAKFMVFDGLTVESGSFNYSPTAENQDNFIDIIQSPVRAELFTKFWNQIESDIEEK